MKPDQTFPRRARDADLDALDDHQLLLVAIEQLAVAFTAEGQADAAERLRTVARSNA